MSLNIKHYSKQFRLLKCVKDKVVLKAGNYEINILLRLLLVNYEVIFIDSRILVFGLFRNEHFTSDGSLHLEK